MRTPPSLPTTTRHQKRLRRRLKNRSASRSLSGKRMILTTAIAALLVPHVAKSAVLYWDGDGGSLQNGLGATGTWDLNLPNWATDFQGANYGAWPNAIDSI